MDTVFTGEIRKRSIEGKPGDVLHEAGGRAMIVVDPVKRVEECGATVGASPAFAREMNAGESPVVGQVHDVLLVGSMCVECRGAAFRARFCLALAPGVDREQAIILVGVGYDDAGQVNGKHGRWEVGG